MKKIKNKHAKKYEFTFSQLQKLIQERVNKMQDVTSEENLNFLK